MKRLLSILLVLSMVLTMLPITAIAEEVNTPYDARAEIIAFTTLTETEKTVGTGTPIENLELPQTLTAMVRTNPDTVTDSVYGSEEGTLADISVTWISQPEYDMDAEGEYIFTPVIEGYIVNGELPKITVRVRTEMVPMMMLAAGAPAVSEQFTGITPGSTYYFDLSSGIGNIGTVNSSLPDTTLHYVPFTYAGTVYAYSLHSRSSDNNDAKEDSENANGNTTNPNDAIGYKSNRSLFVGNYNISSVSWNSLNTNNLIFGKTFDTNYKLRTLSTGSSRTGSASDGADHRGQPDANEWDQILAKSGSTDNTTGWIKNWSGIWSWGQDTVADDPARSTIRGCKSAYCWDKYTRYNDLGFRPALEVLNPGTLGSDGLKEITLNLNGGLLNGSTDNIKIICAGDSFTAPSGEGLTAPAGMAFGGWKDTSSDTIYAAGATVPKTVTELTAQWGFVKNSETNRTYGTIQEAIDNVASGQEIKLIANIDLAANERFTIGDKSFTLDLNGCEINGGSGVYPVIQHGGTGTLTITDSQTGGKITSSRENSSYSGTIYLKNNDAKLIIEKGIVENTGGANSYAINNELAGSVTINGGSLIANFSAIGNKSSGTVTINGGMLKGKNATIYNSGTGSVTVFGGDLIAKGEHATAIFNMGAGSVTVSGGDLIVEGFNSRTIFNNGTGSVTVSGGTIIGEGMLSCGIDSNSPDVEIQRSDPPKPIIIKGEKYAMNIAPDLSGYPGVAITASMNYSGSPTILYDAARTDYKYLRFEPATPLTGTVTITGTPKYGETLTAAYVSGNNTGTLSYQWKRGGSDISGATGNTYTIVQEDIGKTLSCVVTSSVQTGSVSSDATAAIAKANGPAAPTGLSGVAPSSAGGTDGKITGTTTAMEYADNSSFTGAQPCPGIEITNLSPGTYYVRVKATDTHKEGAYAAVTVVDYVPDALTGTVTITGTPKYGETLTAAYVSGNNTGTLSYQWKRGGSDISGATGNTYTIVQEDIGKTLSCVVTSSVQTGSVSSDATAAIAKANGPAAPTGLSGVAPSSAGGTDGKITGTTTAMEYADNSSFTGAQPCSGTEITGLSPGTYYVRVKATDTHKEGVYAAVTVVDYVPDALTGTVTISNTTPRIGDVLNGFFVNHNNTGSLTYAWKAGGTEVSTGASYTVTKADLGKAITLEISSSVERGTVTSAATGAVLKKVAPIAPDAPTLVSKTHNSVTLTANALYEFSKDGSIWQTSNVFNGLTAGTGYTFYQRIAETDDTESSAASTGLSMTTDTSGGGSGGSGSGSGGRSSDDDRDSDRDRSYTNNSSPANSGILITVITPSPDKPDSPTQAEIKVDAEIDENGNATVNISGQYLEEAFNKAMEDAKKNGSEQNGITVVFHVVTGGSSVSNATVNLPKTVQETIISKRIVNTIVVVDNPDIRINMDLATVEEINRQANSDVNVTATKSDNSQLSEEAREAIGSRPVFDIGVNYGSGKQVQSFGDGRVLVTIPYTLGPNEKAEYICAVYIDERGNVHWLTNSVYDSEEKVLRFSTNHFSTYGVGYREEVKEEAPVFTDIENHWAKEDIEFVASHGLFNGTSEATFSPDNEMTRGMFVTVLGRLAKADVSGYKESSFTDVKEDAYYMGYVEWAKEKGIASGAEDGKFLADAAITREQMAVILSNYAKSIGFPLPKIHEEKVFADSDKISSYTKYAVEEMQMAGILNGRSGNLFEAHGTATRAEVSAVFHRLLELIKSADTL